MEQWLNFIEVVWQRTRSRYVSPFGREPTSFGLYSPRVKQLSSFQFQICLMLDLITQRAQGMERRDKPGEAHITANRPCLFASSRDCPFYVSEASFHPEGLAGLAVGIIRFSAFVRLKTVVCYGYTYRTTYGEVKILISLKGKV
jgi:hypothetical protein